VAFRRGFKADAERLARATREEMGIGQFARLDPLALAEHLAIPVMSLSELAERRGDNVVADAVRTLHDLERGAVSAFTVMLGGKKQVVYNDANDPARSANDITHELCHGLLLHQPAPALDQHGCRVWNADLEDEANFQAGALLIPHTAAWGIAKRKKSLAVAAAEYGCSQEVVRMRLNLTGASKRIR
jgi:Zn-dependent peptidase ImmA (M78 family)